MAEGLCKSKLPGRQTFAAEQGNSELYRLIDPPIYVSDSPSHGGRRKSFQEPHSLTISLQDASTFWTSVYFWCTSATKWRRDFTATVLESWANECPQVAQGRSVRHCSEFRQIPEVFLPCRRGDRRCLRWP